jgi:hypothetical protein
MPELRAETHLTVWLARVFTGEEGIMKTYIDAITTGGDKLRDFVKKYAAGMSPEAQAALVSQKGSAIEAVLETEQTVSPEQNECVHVLQYQTGVYRFVLRK